jgi:hypothetical protein
MRSFLVSTVLGLVVATMAASGSANAEEPARISSTRPKIEIAPPVRVAGFHRYGQTGAYGTGAIGIGVDMENTSDKPIDGVTVKLDIGDKVLEQSVSIPPKGTRMATFFDTEGLASSCKAKPYTIMISGPGTGANGFTREAHITPSCAFTSKLEETWNLMSPDKVEAEKAGNAYLTAPALQSSASCAGGPTIKATIIDKSSLSSPSLIVQAKEWTADGKVRSQTAAAFPLATNESKAVLLAPVASSAGAEPTTKLKLGIVDWTKSLQGHTSDGGIFVSTTRSCTLSFALD